MALLNKIFNHHIFLFQNYVIKTVDLMDIVWVIVVYVMLDGQESIVCSNSVIRGT